MFYKVTPGGIKKSYKSNRVPAPLPVIAMRTPSPRPTDAELKEVVTDGEHDLASDIEEGVDTKGKGASIY